MRSNTPATTSLRSLFTIKLVVFGSIAILASLMVGKFGWEASKSWSAYERTKDRREFDVAANKLIKGVYEILLERLTTNNALQAVASADAALTAKIEGYRKNVKEFYDTGLASVELRNFPNKQALLQELKTLLQKANGYRQQADAAMSLPREQRSDDLRKNFVPVLTDSVNASLRVWYAAVYSTASGDSELQKLASIKEIGWKMREFSGTERANIAGAIAANAPLPADRLTANADMRARVITLFGNLQNLTQDANTHPAITEAMRGAQALYFKAFLSLSDEVRKAGEAGKYPITASQWVETTNPQIDSLLAVMQAAAIASEARTTTAMSESFNDFIGELSTLSIGILIVLISIFGVIAQVTRPLSRLSTAMRELADGNFDVVLPGLGRKDEIGAVAQAVEAFKVKATETSRLEAETKMAEEASSSAQRRRDRHKLADDFQATAGAIIEIVSSTSTELEAAANTLSKTAEITQSLSGTVASASGQASANVQSVASAAEEMTSSVNEIARQVQESSKIAAQAVQQAEKTDARIAELSQAAGRIGDVVKLITAIAEQTNLLALNATIEAARAGEAGRGFAVVASEVKQLASQTAKATEEIGTQIAGMQSATEDSVAAIKEIGGTIGRIAEIASMISATVEEQGAATQEIARNVGEAAKGTALVASNISDVNRGASETGSASAQVLSSAQSMSSESARLKIEVEKFLSTVRAA
jgi:methyl-accepting chemotaxis protein